MVRVSTLVPFVIIASSENIRVTVVIAWSWESADMAVVLWLYNSYGG